MPLSRLRAWQKNPRVNDHVVPEVAASIERFGFGAPLIARRENGELIAGHTRMKAAEKLGLSHVPVRFLDISENEAHLLALADNRLSEKADWALEGLNEILSELSKDDVAAAGWNDEELKAMQDLLSKPPDNDNAEIVEDEVPEPPKDPVTKPGDVWVLGRHRLVCGDCRDAAVVKRLVGDDKVNVAFTSPPYASQRKYDETTEFKPIHPDAFVEWFEAVQQNVRDALANDGSWFVNIKEHCDDGQRSLYVKDLTVAHVRRWGWRLIDELCWRKLSYPGKFGARFKNGWEPVFHFAISTDVRFRPEHVMHATTRGVSAYGASLDRVQGTSNTKERAGSGLALPDNVVDTGGARTEATGHAAAFPAALPSFFIRAYSDLGDLIFDPFMGSGTTLIACEQLDRRAVGTELSPAYCDVIIQRWEALTGQKAVRA